MNYPRKIYLANRCYLPKPVLVEVTGTNPDGTHTIRSVEVKFPNNGPNVWFGVRDSDLQEVTA